MVILLPIVVIAASTLDGEALYHNSLEITVRDSIISRDNLRDNLVEIFDELTQRLQLRFGDQYRLENFCFDFTERVEGNTLYVDIDVYFYMTRLEHPRYGLFIQGMQEVMQARKRN